MKRVEDDQIAKNTNKIIALNEEDNMIFKEASRVSSLYIKEHKEYFDVVKKVQTDRSLLLPFTQTLYAPRQSLVRIFKYIFEGKPLFKS